MTGYTRNPMNCEKCRREHGVSPYHVGPDPEADCGKCISDDVFETVRRKTAPTGYPITDWEIEDKKKGG